MPDAMIDFYRSLVDRDPDLASLHVHLGHALLDAGEAPGAIGAASDAIDRDPLLVEAWLLRAAGARIIGDWQSAADDYKRAASLASNRAAILVSAATCYVELDLLAEAEQLLREAVAVEPGNKQAQANLGSVLVKLDRLAEAEAPCRAALAIDLKLVSAHQNLSAILGESDPAAARHHRNLAYQQQQIFIEPALREVHRVIVLAAADAANVPLRYLMPSAHFTLTRWYIEYATPGQEELLPAYDLVFNSIGDPDLAPEAPQAVTKFLQTLGPRLLNRPERVAETSRANLPSLLGGIQGAVVPPVLRYDGPPAMLQQALATSGIALPVLVRPLGSHGGHGLEKIETAEPLSSRPDMPLYATQFFDFRSQDGWYRKYRMIFVGGALFPYHLAISSSWLVHYWTAGMELDAARRDEERAFLDCPENAIGRDALAALTSIGQRLGLDYAGIDFSVLPDGRVLVFEANATMLVHPERDSLFAYRNPAVSAIQDAFANLVSARASS